MPDMLEDSISLENTLEIMIKILFWLWNIKTKRAVLEKFSAALFGLQNNDKVFCTKPKSGICIKIQYLTEIIILFL